MYRFTHYLSKLCLLLLFLTTGCDSKPNSPFYGHWIEIMPANSNIIQGVSLHPDGTASSIGMATLKYTSWQLNNNQLTLSGQSIGNGQTIDFNTTFDVIEISPTHLTLGQGDKYRIRYYKSDTIPTSHSQEVEGTVRLGHEVRSFTDSRTGQEYWLIDKSGQLMQQYQQALQTDIINYQPVYAKLLVRDIGRMSDGFGAEYDGTYEVEQILLLSPQPHS